VSRFTMLLVFAWVGFARMTNSAPVIYADQFEGITVRAVIADSAQFATIAEDFYRGWESKLSDRARLSVIWMFSTEAQGTAITWGKGRFHIDYDWWVSAFRWEANRIQPLALAVFSRRGGVLVMRSATGEIHRRVLGGKDPLRVSINGLELEILDLRFPGMAPRNSVGYEKDYAMIYVRAKKPLTEQSTRLTVATISAETTLTKASVLIRSDSWFIDDPFFPVVYPFEHQLIPPGAEAYSASKTAICRLEGNYIHCVTMRPFLHHGEKTGAPR
jgi:hypothetical protein